MAYNVYFHVPKGRTAVIVLYALAALGLIVFLTIAYGMAVRDIQNAKAKTSKKAHDNTIILPYIPMPSTLRELADAYLIIINAPFAEAREGLGHPVDTALYPSIRPHSTANIYSRKDMLYDTVCRLIALINMSIFILCFGLAVLIHEPTFIITYLFCFCTWVVWAIVRYPYGSFLQKALLVFLLPSMAGFFFYRLAIAPVRERTRATH